MDDSDLVLNLVVDSGAPLKKWSKPKKGGRWTERLKANRIGKRKSRADEESSQGGRDGHEESPPSKRVRRGPPTPVKTQQPAATRPRPGQIISSLFSYNPRVKEPAPVPQSTAAPPPSNAPLGDSSTFTGLGLDPLLVAHLSLKMKIVKPTSIQRSALLTLLPTMSDPGAGSDCFIQAQTGSGKTLSYLLPIIQDLLPLSSLPYIDRSIGTLAIIIAPTRELAKQISEVLESVLQLRLRHEFESPQDPSTHAVSLTRWLVSGLLTGGTTRTHEKSRLRKGIPILVSTPGRLLDHLQNTSSFDVSKCRWLIFDEADRLMDLGFAETVSGIVKALEGRRKLALQAIEGGRSVEVGGWDWGRRRRTVLCSATIQEDVQKLAGMTLTNPIMIKATEVDRPPAIVYDSQETGKDLGKAKFTPPSQLSQKFIVVPLKLRLVVLVALIRFLIAQATRRRGMKIIVFFSCTDSVDFHWRLFGGSSMDEDDGHQTDKSTEGSSESGSDNGDDIEKISVQNSLLPDTLIYRLHGSLPPSTRMASLDGFSGSKDKIAKPQIISILFCTSVASRGLDLPLVRAVIQYDLPTDGGATEYIHRVGRTARAGKGGEAWSVILPSEEDWVQWVEREIQGKDKEEKEKPADNKKTSLLGAVGMEHILRSGLGGEGSDYESHATAVQLSFERWVLGKKENIALARKAYSSHMRAYATHPSNEKHIFHLRHLHLGHLAKSFGLRDAPKLAIANARTSEAKSTSRRAVKAKDRRMKEVGQARDAERRMQNVVREQGRLTKKKGVMVSSGTAEFQIASGREVLEKLIRNSH